jgi:hypothetical protein
MAFAMITRAAARLASPSTPIVDIPPSEVINPSIAGGGAASSHSAPSPSSNFQEARSFLNDPRRHVSAAATVELTSLLDAECLFDHADLANIFLAGLRAGSSDTKVDYIIDHIHPLLKKPAIQLFENLINAAVLASTGSLSGVSLHAPVPAKLDSEPSVELLSIRQTLDQLVKTFIV